MTPILKSKFLFISVLLVSLLFRSGELNAQQAEATSKSANAPTSEITEAKSVVKTNLLAGNWCGYWVSCKNGHNGKLKATFCRLNECQVQAVFVGSFARILPFRYKAVLQIVHEEEGMIQLRGSQRLGPIMGTFSYEATITADDFRATYRSRRDCGQWNMKRVASCCQ